MNSEQGKYGFSVLSTSRDRDSYYSFDSSINGIRNKILNDARLKVYMEMDSDDDIKITRRASEKAFFYYVSTGNIAKISEILHQFERGEEMDETASYLRVGEISESAEKQAMGMFISAVTLYTRAAVDGGLPESVAYNLSDAYIYQTLHVTDPEIIKKLTVSALYDFTYEVYMYKYKDCSPMVKKCCEYISGHLHDPVTMKNLAELTGKSPNYISDCFEKELHIRPITYIRKLKLDYARHVLDAADLSVSLISDLLSFSSTSSFITYFREEFGMTPLQYKKTNGMNI